MRWLPFAVRFTQVQKYDIIAGMMKTALTFAFGLLFGASTSLSTLAATVLYDFETDAEQKAVPRPTGAATTGSSWTW